MDHGSFRSKEFPLLDRDRVTYLDWTGAALPPQTLHERHFQYMSTNVLGNPHSEHPPSKTSMSEMDLARTTILSYFNASPSEYDVVFTSGATGAILLLHHFMFGDGELLLTADNHNSVNGLREVAKMRGGKYRYVPLTSDLDVDWKKAEEALANPISKGGNRLFAMPAKSNYSGVHHDLKWVKAAQKLGWKVLLDAAAYLGNERLDLSTCKPDFVPVSFYKLFGYPTGIGCLLVRKDAFGYLGKWWFAGGSILLVAVAKDFYAQETNNHSRYEDGTQNFASMRAVTYGLQYLSRLDSSGFNRFDHAKHLAREFTERLIGMRGVRVPQLDRYEIHSPLETDVVTFSLIRGGHYVDAWKVEEAASREHICFRTGCFCNPGSNEKVFGYQVSDYEHLQSSSHERADLNLERLKELSGGRPIGAIRVSFGYANNIHDVNRALEFFERQLCGE